MIKKIRRVCCGLWFVSTVSVATPAIEFINNSSNVIFMQCSSGPENLIPIVPQDNKQYDRYSSFWISANQRSLSVVCTFFRRSFTQFATATIQIDSGFQTAYVSSNDFTSSESLSPANATSLANATQNMSITFS